MVNKDLTNRQQRTQVRTWRDVNWQRLEKLQCKSLQQFFFQLLLFFNWLQWSYIANKWSPSPLPVGKLYIRDSCGGSREWRCRSPCRTNVHIEDINMPAKNVKLKHMQKPASTKLARGDVTSQETNKQTRHPYHLLWVFSLTGKTITVSV